MSDGSTEDEPEWRELITAAASEPPAVRRAQRHEGGFPTASKPQKFTCDDNVLRVVKFSQNNHGDGRGIFAEQIVGILGRGIDAPVPTVELVEVDRKQTDALQSDPTLGLDFVPMQGVHHGSRWAGANMSDRQGLLYLDENRARFGALQVLYAWLACEGDHQWIYSNDPPHEVFSVDHTQFLPGAPEWSAARLGGAPAPALDPQLGTLGLTREDREVAVANLARVSTEEIAAAVARPPDAWGVGLDDRVAVAAFVHSRREPVCALYG